MQSPPCPTISYDPIGQKVEVALRTTLLLSKRCKRQTQRGVFTYLCHIYVCMKMVQVSDVMWKCPMCDRIGPTRQSVNSHFWRAHTETGKIHKGGVKCGSVSWNTGKTKETDERVRKNSEAVARTFQKMKRDGTLIPPPPMSEEARRRLSIEQTLHNRGGKSKWFEVDGQKVQGTWERNVAQLFSEKKIHWRKLHTEKDIFPYVIDGKTKRYTPDFYLKDFDTYLETKGYWWGRDKEKMRIVKETYPQTRFLVIEKDEYKKLLSGDLSILSRRECVDDICTV